MKIHYPLVPARFLTIEEIRKDEYLSGLARIDSLEAANAVDGPRYEIKINMATSITVPQKLLGELTPEEFTASMIERFLNEVAYELAPTLAAHIATLK